LLEKTNSLYLIYYLDSFNKLVDIGNKNHSKKWWMSIRLRMVVMIFLNNPHPMSWNFRRNNQHLLKHQSQRRWSNITPRQIDWLSMIISFYLRECFMIIFKWSKTLWHSSFFINRTAYEAQISAKDSCNIKLNLLKISYHQIFNFCVLHTILISSSSKEILLSCLTSIFCNIQDG
jgi:hypothetical protein